MLLLFSARMLVLLLFFSQDVFVAPAVEAASWLNFGEQDLGARLQSWGKKEWGDKATVAQMHEKRYHRRRGTRGQTRQQWWKDRTSGKVAWGSKSYYNAPWNKTDKKDNSDSKDGKDDKKDMNDKDQKDSDSKDDKQDMNDNKKDATDEPPEKKAKAAAKAAADAAPTAPPATPAVPAAPSAVPTGSMAALAAPPAALDGEGLSGSTGSGASMAEVNAADFASAVAKAMVSMPVGTVLPIMQIPLPLPAVPKAPGPFAPVSLPGLQIFTTGPRPNVPRPKAIAAPAVPSSTPAEIPEDGSDTEGSNLD